MRAVQATGVRDGERVRSAPLRAPQQGREGEPCGRRTISHSPMAAPTPSISSSSRYARCDVSASASSALAMSVVSSTSHAWGRFPADAIFRYSGGVRTLVTTRSEMSRLRAGGGRSSCFQRGRSWAKRVPPQMGTAWGGEFAPERQVLPHAHRERDGVRRDPHAEDGALVGPQERAAGDPPEALQHVPAPQKAA